MPSIRFKQRRVIGVVFDHLPAKVRALHDFAASDRAGGRGHVTRSDNRNVCLAARIGRFPPAGRDVPVSVTFDIDDKGETWTRDFSSHVFWSHPSGRHRGDTRNSRGAVRPPNHTRTP